MKHRVGSTLLELVAVLAIIALAFAVVGIGTLPRASTVRNPANGIAAARSQAIVQRRPVSIMITSGRSIRHLTAFPDGQVRADSALDLDPLTGNGNAAR